MIIAEELDLPLDKVRVTLAPARPELLFNQLTGGSNTTVSTFTPIRVAAAIAKGALLEAAAIELGSAVALLKSKDGVITAPGGALGHLRRRWPRRPPAHDQAGRRRRSRTARRSRSSARRSTASTPATSSPARRSSRWTSTSLTRCRRWSAGRRRSNGTPRSVRNKADGAGDAGRHRRRDGRHGRRRARADVRPVHRRHPRPRRGLEPGPGRGRVRRDRRCASCAGPRCRWPPPRSRCSPRRSRPTSPSCSAAAPRSSRTAAIADVRADQRRGLGRPEVADRRPGGHRQGDRPAADQGEGQRDHRRRLVRPQAVRRPRDRGGRRSPRRWASRSG